MFPMASPMLQGGGGASYVGQTNSTSAATLSFPSGTTAGDLAIVMAQNNATVTGWATDSAGNLLRIYWKVLTAADISSPAAITSATNWGMVVYRGPSRVDVKSTSTDSTFPLTLAGFTKNAGRALVTMVRIQNGSPTTPTNFTSRQAMVAGDGFTTISSADMLSPSLYTNGAAIDWPGSGGPPQTGLMALELI